MPEFIKYTSAVLKIVVLGACLIGIVFCVSGIWFVYLGSSGATEFTFFGQTFKSVNAGIAALFLGASTVVLLFRRALRTLDSAIRAETPPGRADTALATHWPQKKTMATLTKKIKALSDTQWLIFSGVAATEGIQASSLMRRLKLNSSVFHLRIRSLQQEELLSPSDDLCLYLHPKAARLLKDKSVEDLRK